MDVHRRSTTLRWITKKIDEEVPLANKTLIYEFDQENIAKGLSIATRVGYLSHLYKLSGIMQHRPFDEAGKWDLGKALEYIEGNGYSDHTKEKFRRAIKYFFKSLGKSEYVEKIRTLSRSQMLKMTIPEETLKMGEIRDVLLKGCSDTKERLFVALLAETGARSGEILTLKTKCVDFDEIGAKLTVSGKTGKRIIRIIRCGCKNPNLAVNLLSEIIDFDKKYIFQWRNHLTKQDTHPSYQWVRHLFERIRGNAGVRKRVHAHLFRHTRATQLSAHLSYIQLCDYFGWKHGSDMPSIYIRVNNTALDNALLQGYGMEPVTPTTICPWC